MMFTSIVGNYQPNSAHKICLCGQPLSCFRRDCGGSELASKQFEFIADDLNVRIFHLKWKSIYTPWKGIAIRANGYGIVLIYKVGIGLCRLWQYLPRWNLWFIEYIFAKRSLNQILLRTQKVGYKYTKSICVNESYDLRRPSCGSGKRFPRNTYGIANCNGSS